MNETISDILVFMGRCGARFISCDIPAIELYLYNMIRDDRVVVIYDNHGIYAVCFFSICNDYSPFYFKATWKYVPHDPTGNTVYVEKLICPGWNKSFRKRLEELFVTKHPQLEYGCWHRSRSLEDKKIWVRRLYNVRDKNPKQ